VVLFPGIHKREIVARADTMGDMPEYQMRTSDDGDWRKVNRWELRKRLSKCVMDVDGKINELNNGQIFRSGYGTFRKRPLKRKHSQTRKLF
jgi:hypothetical protein